MYKQTLGILGGFGAYATLDFYSRFLKVFESSCERNYPHIYMDNNYTMPSRTRALLYGDDYEIIVNEICQSIQYMIDINVDYIIMVCGTAHAFLPEVYERIPLAKEKIINIIECLQRRIDEEDAKTMLVVAAEGTLKKDVYGTSLKKVNCISPGEQFYPQIRTFIEAVKQNNIDEKTAIEWYCFLEQFKCDNVLLGCTELPVLVKKINEKYKEVCKNHKNKYRYWDPLDETLDELKRILK